MSIDNVTTTQLAMGYMNGVMLASAAFIAVAGIIFAISSNRKILDKCYLSSLLASMLLGGASIAGALKWFNSPHDFWKISAAILLFLQFFSWFFPAYKVLAIIGWREGNKNKEIGTVNKNPIKNIWKETLWNLFGPALIVVILTLIWVYFWNKDKESLNQLMQAIMIAAAVLIAFPGTSELGRLSKISSLSDEEKKDRKRAIIVIIPGLLTLLSAILWFAINDTVYCAIAIGFFLVQLLFIARILWKQYKMLK